MSLNPLSKQCIIIGALTLILSLGALTTDTINTVHDLRAIEGSRSPTINDFIFRIALYLVSTLISILLIIGIVKRRYLLMVPWLLQFCAFVVLSFCYILLFIGWSFIHLELLLMTVLILGGETIVLYPICALCHEIRLEGKQQAKKYETYSKF